MDAWRLLLRFSQKHPGKVIGTVLGLFWGLMVIWVGLFWALFLTVTTAAGYWIGKRFDEKEDFAEWLEKILPPGHG